MQFCFIYLLNSILCFLPCSLLHGSLIGWLEKRDLGLFSLLQIQAPLDVFFFIYIFFIYPRCLLLIGPLQNRALSLFSHLKIQLQLDAVWFLLISVCVLPNSRLVCLMHFCFWVYWMVTEQGFLVISVYLYLYLSFIHVTQRIWVSLKGKAIVVFIVQDKFSI